ncbi:MAG: hypothetical protein JO328_21225 [Hyphomicrobiales bacterium]|nr:hypothetical protein [Hyphomicrobiales bacterium]MBV9429087.1 hypothetical protein [Bradyrhizobiaceae bacterium]
MRSIQESADPAGKGGDSAAPADQAAINARAEQIERIMGELAACEKLGDPELARHTGRKLLAVVACATNALLADGGDALRAAPDKFGAYFDKAAAGYMQAIDGLAKRGTLGDAAAAGNGYASTRSVADPPLPAFAPWRSPARE